MFREYDIRGLVDQNFTEEVLARTGKAFGTFLAQKRGGSSGAGSLAVGRDVRLSSARYANSFIAGLRSTGADVVDVGQVPTPLVYFAVNHLNSDGGGAVTASHNPPQYNGLKLRKREPESPNGLPLQPNEIQSVLRFAQEGDFRVAARGSYREHNVEAAYVQYVASRITLARKTKVVLDAGNGVAGPVAVKTLKALDCEVIELYCEPDGNFPNHMPDPLDPKNLQDLIKRVKETGADVGVALDGDGDRLGVVDDRGEILWADQYLILLARDALRERPGASVVFDVKCSMALSEEIERMGGRPVMSRTGYPNIMERRREVDAALAGELSGHVFFNDPVIDFDDGTFAAANLLQAISRESGKLSDWVATVPKYHPTPEERFYCPDDQKFDVIKLLTAEFRGQSDVRRVIDLDGARVVLEDGWGLVRASNTEPALTTRFEAKSEARAREIRQRFMDRLAKIPAVDLARSGH